MMIRWEKFADTMSIISIEFEPGIVCSVIALTNYVTNSADFSIALQVRKTLKHFLAI